MLINRLITFTPREKNYYFKISNAAVTANCYRDGIDLSFQIPDNAEDSFLPPRMYATVLNTLANALQCDIIANSNTAVPLAQCTARPLATVFYCELNATRGFFFCTYNLGSNGYAYHSWPSWCPNNISKSLSWQSHDRCRREWEFLHRNSQILAGISWGNSRLQQHYWLPW